MADKKSIEELAAKAAEAYSVIDAKVKEYNEQVRDGAAYTELSKIKDAIDEAIGDYASYQRFIAFEKAVASEDPMLWAVQNPEYDVVAAREEVSDLEKIPTMTLNPKKQGVDLLKLHKYAGGIGHDKAWPHMVEAFNSKLTARVAVTLGLDPKEIVDSYAMSAIAREMDLGKNPTSNTNLLKTMRGIVTAMIGEDYASSVTSHDVAYLLEAYSKKSRKALTLTVANHRTLRATMMDVCRHLVNGEQYALDYKRRKDEPAKKADENPAEKSAKKAEKKAA